MSTYDSKDVNGPLFGNEKPREPYKSPYPDGLPGHADTAPSRDAAVAWLEKANVLQRRVYALVKAEGDHGATVAELAQVLGEYDYSVAPRITELGDQGLVVGNGQRTVKVCCPNCSHTLRVTRPQTIWVARWRS